jgi:hypothetical protein
MKRTCILALSAIVITTLACKKQNAVDNLQPQANSPMALAKGGSGSGGGSTTNAGIIQSFVQGGASRLVSTRPDSMLVVFSAPAPAAGYTLSFTSSDPAVQVPATLSVPAGATSKHVVLNSTTVTTARNVTITVSVNGQSKSSTIKLYPLTATISAPSLQSPGNGSGFDYHRQVVFDWTDLNEAYYYEIQVASSTAFTTLNFSSGPLVSTTVGDYFDGSGVRYWRVRGVDASGNGGAWSAVRSFTVKPQ